MEIINSQESLRLLNQLVLSKHSSSGVSCIPNKCLNFEGCTNFVGLGKQACPEHLPKFGLQEKSGVKFCPNCYEIFQSTFGFADGKHHCHLCGMIYCASCSDYKIKDGVQTAIMSGGHHHNPFHSLSVAGDRRVCIQCACLLYPTKIVRVDQISAFHTGPHVPLDLCFVFDGTASMVSHISLVEREIGWIVEDIHAAHLVNLHLSAVTYRDHQYGERLLNTIPPQNHQHKFEKMVRHAHAFGAPHNDVPEAMAVGLGCSQTGAGGHWRPLSAKMIVLLADAPPHGTTYSNLAGGDAYPQGDPSGLDPVAVVDSLARDGVAVYTIGVEPSSANNGADRVLRTLAGHGSGVYVPLEPQHHENLHHFIAACVCDLVMKAVCAQEMQQVAIRLGCAIDDIPMQQKAAVLDRVKRRLKSRYMPRFNFTKPTALQSTPSTRNLPIVTGVHRTEMNDGDIGDYIDGVAAAPPVNIPFAAETYAVAVPIPDNQQQNSMPAARPVGIVSPPPPAYAYAGTQQQPYAGTQQPYGGTQQQQQPYGTQQQPYGGTQQQQQQPPVGTVGKDILRQAYNL